MQFLLNGHVRDAHDHDPDENACDPHVLLRADAHDLLQSRDRGCASVDGHDRGRDNGCARDRESPHRVYVHENVNVDAHVRVCDRAGELLAFYASY